MRFRIVNADINRAVNVIPTGPGSVWRLRAQVEGEVRPRGSTFEWVTSPPNCVTYSGKVLVPDYKRTATIRGPGTIYAVLRAKTGEVLALSQIVAITARPDEDESNAAARRKR
jgi:hypothetical protein